MAFAASQVSGSMMASWSPSARRYSSCFTRRVLIPRSLHLFRHGFCRKQSYPRRLDCPRIFYNRASGKMADFLIPEFLLGISMLVQVIADGIRPHIRMEELIKDYPDNLRFLRFTIRVLFLESRRYPNGACPPFHFPSLAFCLRPSIVWTRIFSRSISATADRTVMVSFPESFEESIPSSTQIRFTTVILDILQGIQHIRRVPAKPGQF